MCGLRVRVSLVFLCSLVSVGSARVEQKGIRRVRTAGERRMRYCSKRIASQRSPSQSCLGSVRNGMFAVYSCECKKTRSFGGDLGNRSRGFLGWLVWSVIRVPGGAFVLVEVGSVFPLVWCWWGEE